MELKKIIVGGLILVASAIGIRAYAHSKLSQEEKVERITEKMARKLNLTDEQKAKVHDINLERSKGHQKAYDAGRKKEIIVQAVQKWATDLKEVLTREQQKKLKI